MSSSVDFLQDPKFQQFKPLLQRFYNRFLVSPQQPILCQDKEVVSCGSWDDSRSLFQQTQQVAHLVDVPRQQQAESGDDAAILSILEEFVFPYADPCVPAVCTKSGTVWKPDGHKYTVSVAALNGWLFQNHYDCAAAAIGGAINAAHGFTRHDPLVTTTDVIAVLKKMEAQNIITIMQATAHKVSQAEMDKVQQAIQDALQPDMSGARRMAFLGTPEDKDWRHWRDKILTASGCSDETKATFNSKSTLWVPFNRLRQLRKLNAQTSHSDWIAAINTIGFGLKATEVKEYKFSDIESWLGTPGVALLVHLPSHLGMVFACGRDPKTAKLKHVLVGRPSGGQSPCGWIPFSFKDAAKQEDFWEGDLIGSGAKSISDKTALTMQHMDGRQRGLIVVRTDKTKLDAAFKKAETHAAAQPLPDWLADTGNYCGMCVGSVAPGDTWLRHSALQDWLA